MWRKSKNNTVEIKAPAPSRVSRLWSDSFGFVATRSLQTIVVVVLLAAIIFALNYLSLVVIPVLLALIFASAFDPVMQWFVSHRVPRVLATVILLLFIFVILTGVVWLIVWTIRDQFDELSEKATEGLQQVISWGRDLPFAPSPEQIEEIKHSVTEFLTSSSFGSGTIAGVSAVARFFTGLVLLLVILFFFLKDGPKIWEFMLRPFEGVKRERAVRAGDRTVDILGHYVRGTAAVAFVDAVGIGIGLWIFQVPLALPLSVLVFFLSFIPIVGATLAGTLAALVALVSNGPLNAVIIVAVVVAVNQLESNFLQPVVMGRALKLHALVILIALSVGTLLGGVLGAVLAIPITAVVWGVINVWNGPNLPAKWARPHKS